MRCGCTLLVSMLLLVGCGASRRASSTLPTITGEWQRYPARDADALPPDSPPTEVTERALAQLPPTLAEAYRRMHALGYPSFEGAELRQVEVDVHFYAAPSEAMHRWALVTPAADGAPWAWVGGTWRPVLASGPSEDLVRACESLAALRRDDLARSRRARRGRRWTEREDAVGAHVRALVRVEEHRRARAFERCPPLAAGLPLTARGRSDLAGELHSSASGVDSLFLRMALEWVDALATRVQIDFHQGRDISARHHARWVRRIFDIADTQGVPLSEMLVTTTSVLLDLDRRATATSRAAESDEVETLIARLEDVAVDQRDYGTLFWGEEEPSDALVADATVRALIDLGASASPGLLACARSDHRLSRSFRFGGFVGRSMQRVVPVADLCRLAYEHGDVSAADSEAAE